MFHPHSLRYMSIKSLTLVEKLYKAINNEEIHKTVYNCINLTEQYIYCKCLKSSNRVIIIN